MQRISAASSNENPAAPLSSTGLGLGDEKQGSRECPGNEESRYSDWPRALDRLDRLLAMMVAESWPGMVTAILVSAYVAVFVLRRRFFGAVAPRTS